MPLQEDGPVFRVLDVLSSVVPHFASAALKLSAPIARVELFTFFHYRDSQYCRMSEDTVPAPRF